MKSIFEQEEQEYATIDGRRKETEDEDGMEKHEASSCKLFLFVKLHNGDSFSYNISSSSK